MKSKQLKGFTILEALISLMLMSVIITITYSLFNLIGKQLSFFEKENIQVLEYNLFNSTLMRDIEKAHNFSFSDDELLLKYYDGSEINYTINNHFILRENLIKTDSFELRVIDYEFLNDNSKININTTFLMHLSVLNDTIKTNYFLNKNNADIINNIYFNED